MILVGNQRGSGRDLALHLMKEENDHVMIHEVRGFSAPDLTGAFNEAYAVSKGSRCRQYLFSLSLNPPETAVVSTAAFEAAIDRVESRLGLAGNRVPSCFMKRRGDAMPIVSGRAFGLTL